MIDLIRPNSGDKVLEIGCGWGGFAEYLGKKYDVKLDCITISKKQYEYAKERIFKCGLNEKVNIEIKDYRDLKNKYNSIASIEMIEAVGKNYLESYFKTIKNNLSPDGGQPFKLLQLMIVYLEDIKPNKILFKNIFSQEVFYQAKIA